MSGFRIVPGDALERLREMPSGSFDAVLTDPPYALGTNETRNPRRMSPRKPSRDRATGFMGMAWDTEIPGPEVWREVLRVLRPGDPLLAFGGARTFHRLACAIEDGGFILTDTLCWLHGQGFPKGKSQLKPAWEPITLAWKAGKRALNIDGGRIGDEGGSQIPSGMDRLNQAQHEAGYRPGAYQMGTPEAPSGLGRWPANVILGDEETAAMLDEQSGILTSGNNPSRRSADKHRKVYAGWKGEQCLVHRGTDSGGASMFFYCAKAKGTERVDNEHPTVKPLALTEYLARLILVPGATELLVPFSGSGSEMIGALRAGWPSVTGIEREAAYIAIAQRRLAEFDGSVAEATPSAAGLPLFPDEVPA